MWVSPFRNLRIVGYLPLPEAYRSLSRLSSAPSARASALRPFCLTVRPSHSVGRGFVLIEVFEALLAFLLLDVFLSRLRFPPLKGNPQDFSYMRFSRYALFGCFISHPDARLFHASESRMKLFFFSSGGRLLSHADAQYHRPPGS